MILGRVDPPDAILHLARIFLGDGETPSESEIWKVESVQEFITERGDVGSEAT